MIIPHPLQPVILTVAAVSLRDLASVTRANVTIVTYSTSQNTPVEVGVSHFCLITQAAGWQSICCGYHFQVIRYLSLTNYWCISLVEQLWQLMFFQCRRDLMFVFVLVWWAVFTCHRTSQTCTHYVVACTDHCTDCTSSGAGKCDLKKCDAGFAYNSETNKCEG